MKQKLIVLLALLMCVGITAAQSKGHGSKRTVTISIPGYCCKGLNATIEKTLAYEKGVVSWTLHKEQKSVEVVYREGKTTPRKIAKSLAANGVRVEGETPNPKAISKLPACCQPAARGEDKCAM